MAIIPIIMLIEFKSSSIGKLFILLISIICIPKMANPKKITDKQVNKVKELRALGLSYRKISQKTSLGTTTICRIINGYYD